jgi:hypothetical protein
MWLRRSALVADIEVAALDRIIVWRKIILILLHILIASIQSAYFCLFNNHHVS